MILIGILIGIFIGGMIGVIIMALMNKAKEADREIEYTQHYSKVTPEVNADLVLEYDVICVIAQNKTEWIYNSEVFDEPLRLSDCEDIAGSDRILVIAENALEGAVFRYGNHGFFWEKVGTTEGYA